MNPHEFDNPYVGLRPFESHESLLFYGRRQQIPELLQKLYDTRFLAVVGSSGSGKSSLIRAGLIPHLKAGFLVADRDKWRIVVMKPGNRPLYHLAEAINLTVFNTPDPKEHKRFYEHIQTAGIRAVIERLFLFFHETDANILILVDQFEEIFRFAHTNSQDEAADFVSIILSLSQTKDLPVYTVMTMRSDFIGDCDTFHLLPEAMNQSQYLVPKMTREQRRQAIEGPAAVRGKSIPEPLVQKLLNDSSSNPDQLPVLQHALMRTWDMWQSKNDSPLPDINHYESIGGVSAALSQHADEIYFSLNKQDQLIAEMLFKALTTQDDEGRGIRRNTLLQDLCEITGASFEKVVSILDQFRTPSCSFLVPASGVDLKPDSEIDISHESLMRVWQRLDDWVLQEAESAKRYLRLAETAELYKKEEADFLTDPELKIAETWQEENKPNKFWALRYHPGFDLSMQFLNDSIESRKAEMILARKNARNKNIFRFVIIAMIVLLGLSIFTAVQYQKVSKAREVAERALKNEAKARKIAEEALINVEKERQEANRQRNIALEQKNIAETQRNKVKKQLDEILQLKDTLNPLAAKQGRLYVKTIPDDATITIDTIKQSYSDGIKLDAGTYTIRITHKDYVQKKLKVNIKAGKEKQVSAVKLKPLPGKISISVIPYDAVVFLNAVKKGKGKLLLKDLKPGSYNVKLEKEGYEPVEKEIILGPNQTSTISERLIKYARLTILPKPADASIKIMNIRPVYTPGMYLLPGDYDIVISKKEFVSFKEKIKLDEGVDKKMPVELKPIQKDPEKYLTNKFGMKFVFIKPGEFVMGSPKNEPGRGSDEVQHTVKLTRGFYMQTTEVTQGQWEAIMGSNPSEFKGCGKDCPVENVSWNDAKDYIKKLSAKDGGTYRLPTEAEWEYAARAGTKTALYTGDINIIGDNNSPSLDPIAWYGGNSCVNYKGGADCSGWPSKQYKCSSCGTNPVAQKIPNSWGLHDMIGNVWEWCEDSYTKTLVNDVDPLINNDSGLRVIRGGSWSNDAGNCRSADRSRGGPGDRSNVLGLRLVFSRGQ
ncbi:Sulphatase-modifying factor domain protein [Candidatus Magnetomorum sp. HK-1]|nr:Sulphatase-modifying factor domain protein [Candidatus Magnetomorum sp. HK-1]